jgi:thiol-disulfide isomerase/thioredoxin
MFKVLFTIIFFASTAFGFSQQIYKSKITTKVQPNPFATNQLQLNFKNDPFSWFEKGQYDALYFAESAVLGDREILNYSQNNEENLILQLVFAIQKNTNDTLFIVKFENESTIYKISISKAEVWFKPNFKEIDVEKSVLVNISKTQKKQINVRLFLQKHEGNDLSAKQKYFFAISNYYEGKIIAKAKRYAFYLSNTYKNRFKPTNSGKIKVENSDIKPYKLQEFNFGDTIKLDDKQSVVFLNVSEDLNDVNYKLIKSVNSQIGFSVGFKHPEINTVDIVTKDVISSTALLQNKQFLLLDFWGTWCKPCIAGIPDLINLKNKYDKKIAVISIASEKQSDTLKLLNAINEYKLNWYNIMQANNSAETKDSLLNNYRIVSYPTYVLIDKTGKIVQKVTGYKDLAIIEKYLKKHSK